MAELTTKTGGDVATEVKRIFGDEDGVQIVDADILRWINSAQRSIVSVNPILQKTLLRDTVQGQASYSFPTDRVQYIQALYYKNAPLTAYSYPEAQDYILAYNPESTTTTGTPLIWYQWAQQITLYPAPDAAEVDGLKIDFVAIPEELISLTDPLSLPDRYFESIVSYALQKAHQVDENYDGANYVKSMYTDALAQLSEQENRVSLRSYPVMTVRPEDM